MPHITEPSNFRDDWTAEAVIVLTCIVLSLYNCLELLLLILTTFREWRTLYFLSLMVASLGIIPYCAGFLLEYFQFLVYWACMLFASIGWVMLITGQAFVLYSRLGLLVQNHQLLKAVKWMIIINGVVLHTTTTIVQYGRAYGGERSTFNEALFYVEKIQMTGFCIQEFIISGIYLWKTVQLLQTISRPGTRRVMWELVVINVMIILMDVALLSLEYKGLRTLERAFKSVVYSIKLKLEFAVLGKLVNLVQSSQRNLSSTLADVELRVSPTSTRSPAFNVQDESMPQWVAKFETERSAAHIEDVKP